MKGGITGALVSFFKFVVVIAFVLILTVGVSSTKNVLAVGGATLGKSVGLSIGFFKEFAGGIKSTTPLDTGSPNTAASNG